MNLSLVSVSSQMYRGDKCTITEWPLLYSHEGWQLFRPSFYSEWCQGQAWSLIYVCESVCLWSFSDAHTWGAETDTEHTENPFSLVTVCKGDAHRQYRHANIQARHVSKAVHCPATQNSTDELVSLCMVKSRKPPIKHRHWLETASVVQRVTGFAQVVPSGDGLCELKRTMSVKWCKSELCTFAIEFRAGLFFEPAMRLCAVRDHQTALI